MAFLYVEALEGGSDGGRGGLGRRMRHTLAAALMFPPEEKPAGPATQHGPQSNMISSLESLLPC